MMTLKRFLLLLSLALTLGLPGIAAATSWDLQTDWSDINNPNGAWQYLQGTMLLPHVVWTGTQEAWANTPTSTPYGHVPTWMQVSSYTTSELLAGDIAVHPTSGGSSWPYGEANVIWDSPIKGTISISGDSWWGGYAGTDPRGITWRLYLNDELLGSGSLYTGTVYTRSNPMSFGTFIRTVDSNDVVRLEAVTMEGYNNPWFIGVNLAIDEVQSQVPEPTTMLLLGLGLVGLAGARRKMHK